MKNFSHNWPLQLDNTVFLGNPLIIQSHADVMVNLVLQECTLRVGFFRPRIPEPGSPTRSNAADLRWNWYHNQSRNKVYNKCNALNHSDTTTANFVCGHPLGGWPGPSLGLSREAWPPDSVLQCWWLLRVIRGLAALSSSDATSLETSWFLNFSCLGFSSALEESASSWDEPVSTDVKE